MYATQLKTRLIGVTLSVATTFGILAATDGYMQHLRSNGSDATVQMEPVVIKPARVAEQAVDPGRG